MSFPTREQKYYEFTVFSRVAAKTREFYHYEHRSGIYKILKENENRKFGAKNVKNLHFVSCLGSFLDLEFFLYKIFEAKQFLF